MSSELTLGWLGTGRMGAAMAGRLLQAGNDVTVWNRTRSKTDDLAKAGAKVADTIHDLAQEGDAPLGEPPAEFDDGRGLSAMGWLWWLIGAVLAVLVLLFAISQCSGDDDAGDPVAGLYAAGEVAGFGGGEIAQQLPGIGIRGAFRGGEVEMFRIALHRLGLFADAFDPEIFHQPDRAARVVAGDMFAADQRDHVAEPLAVQVDQALAVLVFFGGHAVEYLCGIGKFGTQHFRVRAVDAGVVLFRGDGKGQNLLFAEVAEMAALGEEAHDVPTFRMVLK